MIAIHLVFAEKESAEKVVIDLLAKGLIYDAVIDHAGSYFRVGYSSSSSYSVVARTKALLFSKIRNRVGELNYAMLMCFSVPITQIDEAEGNALLDRTEKV